MTEERSGEKSLQIKVRRFSRSKKFKFWVGRKTYVFSKPEIKRLFTDKLTRSANLHATLYRCRIFKKCNRHRKNKNKSKRKSMKKSKKNPNTRVNKRRNKNTNRERNKNKKNTLGRAVGIKFQKPKRKTGKQLRKQRQESKTSLFRGINSFLKS